MTALEYLKWCNFDKKIFSNINEFWVLWNLCNFCLYIFSTACSIKFRFFWKVLLNESIWLSKLICEIIMVITKTCSSLCVIQNQMAHLSFVPNVSNTFFTNAERAKSSKVKLALFAVITLVPPLKWPHRLNYFAFSYWKIWSRKI